MRSELGEKLDNLAKLALSAINNLSDNARVRDLKQRRHVICLVFVCSHFASASAELS
jgi:hypothetical protein